jgi:rhamnosyltransferase
MNSKKTLPQERPRVLVLLATYNGARWIEEQLASILAQEEIQVEVRIYDDCSTDMTVDLIRRHHGNDTRVQLTVWPESSGSAGANFRRMFREVSAAGYAYVALADQDDIWLSRKLYIAIDAMERSQAVGYSCAVQSFWEDGREKILRQNAVSRPADYLFEGGGQGCTFVFKNALFSSVQRLCRENETTVNTLHYHDWLIYLLARVEELRWYFDENAWMRYRQHSGNEIGSRGGGLGSIVRRLDLIRNGWYREQVRAALSVSTVLRAPTPLIARFTHQFNAKDSVLRRIWITKFVVQNGRRRFSDRMVLGLSAMCGWI